MNRRRLLGIGCALVALALAPAAPPARAQLLPPPPAGIEDKIDPALLALMQADPLALLPVIVEMQPPLPPFLGAPNVNRRSEEHTSELQSRRDLVCRLLLEKKKEQVMQQYRQIDTTQRTGRH